MTAMAPTVKLGAIVRNESAAVGLPAPRLVVEPGRAIAGPGTITLYQVGTVKDVAGDGVLALFGALLVSAAIAMLTATIAARLKVRRSAA